MKSDNDQNSKPDASVGAEQDSVNQTGSADGLVIDSIVIGDAPQNNEGGEDSDTGEAQAIFNRSAAAALAIESASNKKSGSRIAWFALLLVLVVAGLTGYLGWMLLQQQQQLHAVEVAAQSYHQRSLAFDDALVAVESELRGELGRRDQRIAVLEKTVSEANAILEGHSRRLLSLTSTTTDDWRVAEVEYLLRLANQRILTSKDASTALNLLAVSDQILLELGDPRLFAVRKAIAEDNAAIAIVGEHDIDGVFLKLSALAKQVSQLVLITEPKFKQQQDLVPVATAGQQSRPAWLQKIVQIAESTWLELKGLVVVQPLNAEIKPLLSPPQQYYLRNNLRLLIGQAQLALLDGREKVYQESLSNALSWLQEYFPLQQHATQKVIAEIKQLAGVKVSAEYPDVSASLLAIKAFMAKQHSLVVPSNDDGAE